METIHFNCSAVDGVSGNSILFSRGLLIYFCRVTDEPQFNSLQQKTHTVTFLLQAKLFYLCECYSFEGELFVWKIWVVFPGKSQAQHNCAVCASQPQLIPTGVNKDGYMFSGIPLLRPLPPHPPPKKKKSGFLRSLVSIGQGFM